MWARGIDFSTLTLRTALGSAIVLEASAREFYLQLARAMSQWNETGAAQFFIAMAKHEEAHRAELVERHRAVFGGAAALETHPGLVALELEAPRSAEVASQLTVREALKMALHNETRARGFFLAALDQIAEPDVRALFGTLYEEEVEHVRFVRAQLAVLAPDVLAEDELG
ncbi:MAG: ferritin family protein [Myxococcota bacterium]|jgi:rubrerythrin